MGPGVRKKAIRGAGLLAAAAGVRWVIKSAPWQGTNPGHADEGKDSLWRRLFPRRKKKKAVVAGRRTG